MGLLHPSTTLYIGDLPSSLPPLSSIPIISSSDSLESLTPGTLLRRWDFVSQFNSSCLKPSEIEPLRRRSDELADGVVEVLGLAVGRGAGKDAYEAVRDYLQGREKELGRERWENEREGDVVWRFWEEMGKEPPEEVSGLRGKDRRATPLRAFEQESAEPNLAEGQRVFWKYSAQIFMALMHFSLAGGFSAPRLAAVLHETNYLTSSARDATFKRLLETTLFVLDAMSDMTVGTGRGWKSAMRVRLLHAQVRRRILTGKGRYNTYDVDSEGLPINQADLMAVLGAFMVAPMWSLRRMGIQVSPREEAAYQVAWRHVGYYLGLDIPLLHRLYGSSFHSAESAFASLAYSIFPSGSPPSDPLTTPQYRILSAVCGRPPRGKPIGHHLELCRRLLGPKMADQLALPRGRWTDKVSIVVEIWSGWALLAFGQVYAKVCAGRGRRWEQKRQDWFRRVMELLVVYQLGERRTVFAWREEGRQGEVLRREEGEEPGIEMGKHIGVEVRAQWKALLVEMGAAAATVVAGGVGAWYAISWVRSLLF
ncbi:hypothetical protein JCM21900_005524 [Sporobolomyces salmonicolor]